MTKTNSNHEGLASEAKLSFTKLPPLDEHLEGDLLEESYAEVYYPTSQHSQINSTFYSKDALFSFLEFQGNDLLFKKT